MKQQIDEAIAAISKRVEAEANCEKCIPDSDLINALASLVTARALLEGKALTLR